MPPGKGKIRSEDGKPFSKENQPANRGRKPKVFSQIAKEFSSRGIEKATPQAVHEAIEYLLALPLSEVIAIAGKPDDKTNDYPALMRICAAEMIGKRRGAILNDMLDRAHGRARQSIDHTTGGQRIEAGAQLSDDRVLALLEALRGGEAKHG